jgi:polyhydroxybutyrate depolymerase
LLRNRPLVAALLAVALTAVGCSLSSGAADASARSHALSPGDHNFTLVVQGMERDFILHVPPGAPVAGRPLFLIFHGANATAGGTIGVTDFEQESNRTGEIVAFLQGVNNHWNEYSGVFGSGGVNDVAYTAAVIQDIERHIGFDHARIVAAGFSNGALMVESLGCQLAKTLAMVVPVEGQITTTMAKTCAPARPISVYEIHGTSDALISYWGGGHLSVLSAPASVAKWAALDHCAKKPRNTTPSSSVKITTYVTCKKSVHVALMTIYGGVHRWTPGIGEIVTAALPWKK